MIHSNLARVGLLAVIAASIVSMGCTKRYGKPSEVGKAGSKVEIPLTGGGTGAAWGEHVTTKVEDKYTLRATFEKDLHEWGGFGNPTVGSWQGYTDLSAYRSCHLEFQIYGEGIDQLRVKFSGPEEKGAKTPETGAVSLARAYDECTHTVKIKMSEFAGENDFPWKAARQLVFDVYDPKVPVDVYLRFPIRVTDCK